MAAPDEPTPADEPEFELAVKEVRYSLPQLLRELRLERTGSLFAKEILDQMEISQIFTVRRKKHGKRRQ